jgi:DNA-binding transcriptional LysR family regulator
MRGLDLLGRSAGPTGEVADPWLGLNLRHLLALRAIAEHGSFSRAAAALGYTQSAISHQLASLEAIVGTRLINRPASGRPVSLTPAGEVVLRCSTEVVQRLAAASRDVRTAVGDRHELRIGFCPNVGGSFLAEIIGRLGHAGNGIDLCEASSDLAVIGLLDSGAVDLALIVLPPGSDHIHAEPLVEIRYSVVARSDSALARQARKLGGADLAGLHLICARSEASARVIRQLQAEHEAVHVRFWVDDLQTQLALAQVGAGVPLVARGLLLSPEFVQVPLAGSFSLQLAVAAAVSLEELEHLGKLFLRMARDVADRHQRGEHGLAAASPDR